MLQPDMPPQGLPWREFAERKFGGWEQVQAAFARLNEAAAPERITFSADAIATAANTRDGHRLVLLAQEEGKAWEMADALFAAYFVEGRDLNDRDQLVELAVGVGLDAETARSVLASDWYQEDVDGSQQLAGELRVAASHPRPQVKTRVGEAYIQHLLQHRRDLRELLAVQGAVFHHVALVAPGRDAGGLHHRAHGAAVVGAIEQEFLDQP